MLSVSVEPWAPAEDERLRELITINGTGTSSWHCLFGSVCRIGLIWVLGRELDFHRRYVDGANGKAVQRTMA
jgi:hypothetical protein